MPYSRDEQRPSGLPRPELNPLENPVLGNNLGRWAQVYFTSPPEQRDQAVGELLRELEEDPNGSATAVAPATKVRCRECGAANDAQQKFCGACGTLLLPEAEEMPPNSIPFTHDVQWLRDRAIEHLQETEEQDQRGAGLWKYVLISFLLMVAGFGVLEWVSRRPPRAAPAAAAVSVTPQAVVQEPPPPSPQPVAASPSPVAADAVQKPPHAAPAESAAGNGAQELQMAEGYLQGKTGRRDPAEAAKLLWVSVGKQNVSALVLLSGLYAAGDGVTKSCDQARLLLVAAAKKGSSYAAGRLQNLETSGCK